MLDYDICVQLNRTRQAWPLQSGNARLLSWRGGHLILQKSKLTALGDLLRLPRLAKWLSAILPQEYAGQSGHLYLQNPEHKYTGKDSLPLMLSAKLIVLEERRKEPPGTSQTTRNVMANLLLYVSIEVVVLNQSCRPTRP